MTGFGRADFQNESFSVNVEIKSVNSRYIELSTRLPNQLQEYEAVFRATIQKKLNRGKFFLSVKVEDLRGNKLNFNINSEKLQHMVAMLKATKQAIGEQDDIALRDLIPFMEHITENNADSERAEELSQLGNRALEKALDALIEQRLTEGQKLEVDLLERLHRIERALSEVEKLAPLRIETAREKLLERIQAIISNEKIDKERLEQEITLLADKLDITEEIVRLKAHISYFRSILESPDSGGRKLNFLVQEMNREINTIGSKANHAEIAQHAVDMKEILEQIREQIQNIE